MENERQEEKPQVEGGISLFKILVIVLLIIIVGLLVYMYRVEYRNYDKIDTNSNRTMHAEEDFYYKGVPDEVNDERYYDDMYYPEDEYYKKPDYKSSYDGVYTSQPKTIQYVSQPHEVDEVLKSDYEEQKKKIDDFNATKKSNITLANIYTDSENRLSYTYELMNNNAEPVENICLQVVFYDNTNKIIAVEDLYFDFIPANSSAYSIGNLNNLNYAKYDYLVSKTYHRGVTEYSKDKLEYEVTPDNSEFGEYSAMVKNNTDKDLNALFRATYVDAEGKIIRIEDNYVYLSANPNATNLLDKIKDAFSESEEPEYAYYEGNVNFSKFLFGKDEYREDPVPYGTCSVEIVAAYRYDDYDVVPETDMSAY